jgi:hypothetical protein
MDFACCKSCGWAAIPDERKDKVVFYDGQDEEAAFDESPTLSYALWLNWSGDPTEIMKALIAEGLIADWNGDPGQCIAVLTQELIDSLPPDDPLSDDIRGKSRGVSEEEEEDDEEDSTSYDPTPRH